MIPKLPVQLVMTALAVIAVTLVAPSDVGATGLLLPSQEALPPLAIKSHRVTIDVTDQASVTRVEQVFVNHTNQQLEATFYFPVPRGATVSQFALWINGKKTPGAVLDKHKARATYERIVRRVRDPGLVEYMDGSIFQARIFPVPARGEQKVEISFATVLDRVGSLRKLVYPLKTGRTAARLMEDFTITLNVDSKVPLAAIYSPTHRVDVHRKSDHRAIVGVEQTAADLEEDFLLYIGTSEADDIGLSLLTYDPDGPGGKDGTFLMVLAPKVEHDPEDLPSKAITFVVDTSGSMAGDKIKQARAALLHSLKAMRPGDRFNIVAFSTSVKRLYNTPQPLTENSLKAGLDFAAGLEAAGGTAIDDALTEALGATVPSGMPHFVLFMTDGRPTVGAIEPAEILGHAKTRNKHGARIFAFGIGYDVNPVLLDAVARDHRGYTDYVRPREDIKVKVASVYNKIAYPVMTGLSIDYGTPNVHDVYPRQLPDLFRGGQVVVMGRFRGNLPSEIKLSGQMLGRGLTVAFDEIDPGPKALVQSTAHDFIPKLWATRKVGYLLEEIRAKGELGELKDEVVRLATTFGLVTPYTSYLAVDDSEFEEDAAPGMVRGRHVAPQGGETKFYDFDDVLIDGHLRRDSRNYWSRGQREEALSNPSKFKAQGGKGSVDVSIATNNLKAAESKDEADNNRTRFIDGELFVLEGGTWVEQDTKGRTPRRIKYLSKEYFDLVEKRPDIKRKLSVGDNVQFEMDGEALMVE